MPGRIADIWGGRTPAQGAGWSSRERRLDGTGTRRHDPHQANVWKHRRPGRRAPPRAPTAGYRCTWPSGARWLRNAFPARGARHGCRVAAGRCVCRSGVVDLDVQDGAVAVVWSAVLVAAITGGQPQAPGWARLDGTQPPVGTREVRPWRRGGGTRDPHLPQLGPA